MKIVNMRKVNKGNIRAFFHVEDGPWLIRDFKLMESATGLWVSFPKKKVGDTWEPVIMLADQDDKKTKELLSAIARDEYTGAK